MLNWSYHSICIETNIYCCFKISREQSLGDEAISICKEIIICYKMGLCNKPIEFSSVILHIFALHISRIVKNPTL